MMRRMTTVGILFGLVFLARLSTGAGEVGGPVVFLKEDHIDFKEVLEGEVITHSFIVMNTGNDALKILRVKPG
jgi:hypothetical protein